MIARIKSPPPHWPLLPSGRHDFFAAFKQKGGRMRRIVPALRVAVLLLVAPQLLAQQGAQAVVSVNETMIRMEPLHRFMENTRLGAIVHLAAHDAVNSIP